MFKESGVIKYLLNAGEYFFSSFQTAGIKCSKMSSHLFLKVGLVLWNMRKVKSQNFHVTSKDIFYYPNNFFLINLHFNHCLRNSCSSSNEVTIGSEPQTLMWNKNKKQKLIIFEILVLFHKNRGLEMRRTRKNILIEKMAFIVFKSVKI